MQAAIREYQSHLESILLSTRADEDLKKAMQSDDYQMYSRSLFGLSRRTNFWSGNKRTLAGISECQDRRTRGRAQRKEEVTSISGLSLFD